MANVFHAAALAGVERIIFASSNHVMGGYRELDDGPITVERDPLPDGPYGAAKLFGERLGQSLARTFDLTFVALRLGWIQEGPNRSETLPDDWSRKHWLSNTDLVRLFDCAVEAEIEDRTSSWSTACRGTTACAGTSPMPPSCSVTSRWTTPSRIGPANRGTRTEIAFGIRNSRSGIDRCTAFGWVGV